MMTLVDLLGSSIADLHVRRWGDGRPHRRLSEWPLLFQTYEQYLKTLRNLTGDLGYWHGVDQDLSLISNAVWMTGGVALPPSDPTEIEGDRRTTGMGKLFVRFGDERFQVFCARRNIEIDDEETEPALVETLTEARDAIVESDDDASFRVGMAVLPWLLESGRAEDSLEAWVDEHRERDVTDYSAVFDVGLRVDVAPAGLPLAAYENGGWVHPGVTILLGFNSVG